MDTVPSDFIFEERGKTEGRADRSDETLKYPNFFKYWYEKILLDGIYYS